MSYHISFSFLHHVDICQKCKPSDKTRDSREKYAKIIICFLHRTPIVFIGSPEKFKTDRVLAEVHAEALISNLFIAPKVLTNTPI